MSVSQPITVRAIIARGAELGATEWLDADGRVAVSAGERSMLRLTFRHSRGWQGVRVAVADLHQIADVPPGRIPA